jgi:hypothetical protein
MTRRWESLAIALAAALVPATLARAADQVSASPGFMLPPRAPGGTRAIVEVRPFLSVTGNGGGGAIADLVLEHEFLAPWKIWGSLSPLALGIDRYNRGSVLHARLGAGYVTDFLELGLSAGGREQNLGAGGFSLAAHLRLGARDGVNAAVTYGYVVARNDSTGEVRPGFSNARLRLEVPVHRRAKAFLDGAFSFDVWAYAILGLQQTLRGDLTEAPWRLSAGFGLAWVIDRLGCTFRYPTPCPGTASALGPTIALGVERRF